MKNEEAMLNAVIETVKSVCRDKSICVEPTTSIMTEVDLDSLAMLELIGALKAKFGTDFLDSKYSMEDLLSPATIVAALLQEQQSSTADLSMKPDSFGEHEPG
jgi:acyl carrier protein